MQPPRSPKPRSGKPAGKSLGKPGGKPRGKPGGNGRAPQKGVQKDQPQERAPKAPPSARAAAVRMLNDVLGEAPRLLSELREAPWTAAMAAPERARALRLATETLRNLERCDRMLAKPLQKQPPLPVLNVLRLGTFELCTGGAAHGVVNDLVQITGRIPKQGHMKGLVNAVLRKIAANAEEWQKLRAPRLADWLREPLAEAYGRERILGFETAHAAGAPLDLTPRSPEKAAELAEATGGVLLPTGSVRVDAGQQVSALPGYEEGAFWVQDAAAALPARILAPKPGEVVLDLCAAPGGKTLQLAAAGAEVTAVDLSEARLKRLHQNLARTGLKARVLAEDGLAHKGAYDAVLLDAPCSATGTIRRHPDLPLARDGAEIGELIALQSAMLDHALSLLKPGGRLVFCTCSLLPDEGECQVEEALERHPDLSVDRAALDLPGVDPAWRTEEGGLRLTPDLWPDLGGMDGFYMAMLRRS